MLKCFLKCIAPICTTRASTAQAQQPDYPAPTLQHARTCTPASPPAALHTQARGAVAIPKQRNAHAHEHVCTRAPSHTCTLRGRRCQAESARTYTRQHAMPLELATLLTLPPALPTAHRTRIPPRLPRIARKACYAASAIARSAYYAQHADIARYAAGTVARSTYRASQQRLQTTEQATLPALSLALPAMHRTLKHHAHHTLTQHATIREHAYREPHAVTARRAAFTSARIACSTLHTNRARYAANIITRTADRTLTEHVTLPAPPLSLAPPAAHQTLTQHAHMRRRYAIARTACRTRTMPKHALSPVMRTRSSSTKQHIQVGKGLRRQSCLLLCQQANRKLLLPGTAPR